MLGAHYMDTPTLIYLIFTLLGTFAALLWLRPEKREALRYALILLSGGGLLYILSTKAATPLLPLTRTHLLVLSMAIVFLLGVYMLKSPWRRVIYALGVYGLVSSLVAIADLAYNWQTDSVTFIELLLAVDFYLGTLIFWVFVWWCTRKDERLCPVERLYAAAAFALFYTLLTNYYRYAAHYLAEASGSRELPIFTAGLLLLLCLGVFLRYAMQQPWKRSLSIAAVCALGTLSLSLTNQLITTAYLKQSNLVQELLNNIEAGDMAGVETCLRQGANVNKPFRTFNQEGDLVDFYPLIYATDHGQTDMVAAILAAGADVHVRSKGGNTALLSACIYDGKNDNMKKVDLLLKAGADVNAANDEGSTPLIIAVLTDSPPSVIKALLQAGAYVNATGKNGITALHYAATPTSPDTAATSEDIMRMLLAHGAMANARDCDGNTPLHLSALEGFTAGVRLLLEHKADPTLCNNEGHTPLDLARQNKHTPVEELLNAAQRPTQQP